MQPYYNRSGEELYHHGIKGQKWGFRRFQNKDGSLTPAGKRRIKGAPERLEIGKSDSTVTQKVKNDYNNMSDEEFMKKYSTSKKTYARRVEKYGDPYKNSPLAKVGKQLKKNSSEKHEDSHEDSHEDYKKSHDSKSVKSMSDKELRERLNRLQMEKQYSQLSGSDVNKGKQYLDKVIKAGTTVATVTSTALTIYNNTDKIKNIITKAASS